MQRLEGRIALITGGASGIGKATAERFVAEGAKVVISDVQVELGEKVAAELTAKGGEVVFVKHDVSDEKSWVEVLEKVKELHGGLDILFNNAGVGESVPIEDLSVDDYHRTIRITQDSVFLGMKLAAPMLKESKHASVINTSSIFGASGGFGASPGYHAAKGAVRLMTKSTAIHWAKEGIRVNSVHPGFIDTPIIAGAKGTPFEDLLTAVTPMGRLGKPEEIAAGVAFLASDDASFVTGTELFIDGGYMAP